MKKLLLATTNQGKLEEFKHALKNIAFKLVSPQETGIAADFDVEETGSSLRENAILKAKAYANKSGVLTLTDDTGLIVETLDGRPGIHSARYAPNARARNKKLLQEMQTVNNRNAHFEAVIALYDPQRKRLKTCRGISKGKILHQPKGSGGFGYDPIFFSYDLNKSFGEASREDKLRVSARGLALKKVAKILKNWG